MPFGIDSMQVRTLFILGAGFYFAHRTQFPIHAHSIFVNISGVEYLHTIPNQPPGNNFVCFLQSLHVDAFLQH